MNNNKTELSVSLGEMVLENPIITASGTCGYGEELQDYIDLKKLGAVTVKGLTVNPTSGNPTPRIAETPSGLLNSIGLENPGIDNFIKNEMEIIRKIDIPVIANISGHSLEDFNILSRKLDPYPEIAAVEVNVSCPNLEGGGMVFGTDKKLVEEITAGVKNNFSRTVITKLTPNVTDIGEIAAAAEAGGADAVSLINTLLGMKIDIEKKQPVLGNIFGGLSGPAVKPVALAMVYQVYKKVDIPILGMGGIMKGEDALEFILAGAAAVEIGTATLVDPTASVRILKEIKEYLLENDMKKLEKLRGRAH